MIKKLSLFVIACLTVLIVAVVSIVTLVDPDEWKPEIQKLAEKQGVALEIKGKLHWELFPPISVAADSITVQTLEAKKAAAYVETLQVQLDIVGFVLGGFDWHDPSLIKGIHLSGVSAELDTPDGVVQLNNGRMLITPDGDNTFILSSQAELQQLAMGVKLSLDVSGALDLAHDRLKANLLEVDYELLAPEQLSRIAQGQIRLEGLGYQLALNTVDVRSLLFTESGSTLNVELSGLSARGSDAHVSVAGFSVDVARPDDLMALTKISLPVNLDKASLRGVAELRANRLYLKDLDGAFDQRKFSGFVRLPFSPSYTNPYQVRLNLDTLDVDQLLSKQAKPVEKAETASFVFPLIEIAHAESAAPSALSTAQEEQAKFSLRASLQPVIRLPFQAELNAETLRAQGLEFADVHLRAHSEKDRLVWKALSFKHEKGKLESSGGISIASKVPKLKASTQLTQFPLKLVNHFQPSLNVAGAIDGELDVTAYGDSPVGLIGASFGQFSLKSHSELRYKNLFPVTLNAEGILKEGNLYVQSASGDIMGGKFQGSLYAEPLLSQRRLSLSSQFSNLPVGELMKAAGEKAVLDGRANGSIKMSATGRSNADRRKSLTGKVSLDVKDATLNTSLGNLDHLVCQVVAYDRKVDLPSQAWADETHFETLTLDHSFVKGVGKGTLVANSKRLKLNSKGQVDLAKEKLNYKGNLNVQGWDELANKSCKIGSRIERTSLPYRCKGRFSDNPIKLCQPDWVALGISEGSEKINKEVDRFFKKHLGDEADPELKKGIKGLLDGLLK